MHPPGLAEEHTAVGRHGRGVAEQVLEGAATAAARVRGLGDLRQLRGVAEQEDVARGAAGGERVRERELPCLVDDLDVDGSGGHVVTGEQPGRPGDQAVLLLRCGRVDGAVQRRRADRPSDHDRHEMATTDQHHCTGSHPFDGVLALSGVIS